MLRDQPSAVVTVANNKKVYVKSIAFTMEVLWDTLVGTVACTAQVYVVPNGGAVGDATRML